VGFPGETESEFEESLQAISEIGFSHVHTFPYSIRGGTRAERMPGQVSNAEKTRRARLIRERADEAKARYRRSMIGRGQELLIERLGEDGSLSGYGEHYIPIQASADSFEWVPRRGDLVPVRLTELLEDQEQTLRAESAR
jgi:threonylcarbamoyladenosine tRNA methylthiotransferase MtaB